MDGLRDFVHLITSVEGITQIIAWGGLLILIGIVYAETGLLVGFFLPGDSLLITAGFIAQTKPEALHLSHLLLALPIAAILGDSTGYAIGRKAGVALYHRPRSKLFHSEKLQRTKEFYERYGAGTIILAKFVPFARTFAPVVAGIAEMSYRRFVVCVVCGAYGWVTSMTLVGYFLGSLPFVQHHLEKVLVLVILLSVTPVILHAWKARRDARETASEV